MTSRTGSSVPLPKLPAWRDVVNARMPKESKSPTASTSVNCRSLTSFGMTTSWSFRAAVLDADDLGAQRVEALVDALVSALDLRHVVDDALAVGRQRRGEHGHPGADVGGLERRTAKPRGARHQRAMRIAEDDARAHADQLVNEE